MPPRKRQDTGPGWTAPGEKATLAGFLGHLRTAIMAKRIDLAQKNEIDVMKRWRVSKAESARSH